MGPNGTEASHQPRILHHGDCTYLYPIVFDECGGKALGHYGRIPRHIGHSVHAL